MCVLEMKKKDEDTWMGKRCREETRIREEKRKLGGKRYLEVNRRESKG